jgi:transglutaminase-like putative cysteine protease
MLISVRASATYELPSESFVLLMVEPAMEAPDHRVKDARLVTSPAPYSVLGTDHVGNPQRRIVAPAGEFRYEYAATIEAEPNVAVPPGAVEPRPEDLPPETLVYLLPSRYIESDRFRQMARGEFGSVPSGGRRVQAVCDWVRSHVKYEAGSTDETTSVMDTAVVRLGVCRDFAQMVIALCRGLGIPARYVSGYALGLEPFDFHAFAQVYVGGRWYNVDATYDGTRPALIPIAVGRDAADVDMATFTGPNKLKEQKLRIEKLSD